MWSRLYAHVIHAVTQDPVFQRVPGLVRWSAIVIFKFLLILNEGSDISSYTDAERSHRMPKTNALSGRADSRADSPAESREGGGKEERGRGLPVAVVVPPAVLASFWLQQ